MFKYKFYEFFNKENKALTIQFEFSKFLIGGFFTESSIINLCSLINKKLNENPNLIQKINWSFFPFNIYLNEQINNINNEANDILLLKEIFSDLKVIIIPNFKSIISYILIYKLILTNEDFFQINKEILNKIMIYSTEPIIQFAHCYLNEFYSSFNSILIKYAINNNASNENGNENEFLKKKLCFINNNDIECFLSHIIGINYNEKINYLIPLSTNSNSLLTSSETSSIIEKYIKFEFCSNGYELGSSNILFQYYNKTIYIMTKSSRINNRYPKIFDINTPKECDYLLIFPDIINYNNNSNNNISNIGSNCVSYEDNFKELLNSLYKSNDINNFESLHIYPFTLILTDPFFMLEYCDVFKYKLKYTKTIYFSKSIKSLFKYSNISLGFLNDNLVNKIYNFNMPFSFGDLEKEKYFIIYNDMIEFQNQLVNIINNNIRDNANINDNFINNMYNSGINQNTYYNKNNRKSKKENENNSENNKEFINGLIDRLSPFCFISHYFSIYSSNNQNIYDFFMNNYDNKYDKIIIISNNSDYNNGVFNEIKNKLNSSNIIFENYILDYRLDTDKFNQLIKIINPKIQLDEKIINQFQEINILEKENSIFYDNCYLLSNNNKGFINQLTNYSELNLDFLKEQLRYNITLDNKKNNIKINNNKDNNNNSENKNKKNKKKKGNENNSNDNNNINIIINNKEEPAPIEQTEEILGKYLEMNDMEITEYLNKENCIEIAIFNKLKKTYTEIKINNYYKDNNIKILINKDEEDNDKDNKDNKKSKNNKSNKKSSKTKENKEDINKMEIEEEEYNNEINNEKIEEELLPSIEINSEDTEDSIFLNTLFNSIFV